MAAKRMRSALLLACLVATVCAVRATTSYRAATVQYRTRYVYPQWPNAQSVTVSLNLAVMPKIVANASAQGAQIVVFPEGGPGYFLSNVNGTREYLAGFCEAVPNASAAVNPCTDDSFSSSSQLKTMSCAARQNKVYVVYNMCDKQACTPGAGAGTSQGLCGPDAMYLYDTSVVFAPDGQVVTKYWKYNLFSGDFLFNRLTSPDLSTAHFETSFGVHFGFFICFDISYRDPSVAVLSAASTPITDVVFSTDWINSNVFTAIGFQQAYSRAQGVNLIASNSAECPDHCGGGLYSQGNPIDTYWVSDSIKDTRVIIGDLPILGAAASPAPPHRTAETATLAAAVGNITDCGFGPESCNVFDAATVDSGSLTAHGAAGLTCTASFSIARRPAASEYWALQALDYNASVPHSPSVQNQTSCILLRCTIKHHASSGAPYCYVPTHYKIAGSVFNHISVTAHNLHDDTQLFPMYTVRDARVVAAANTSLTTTQQPTRAATWATTHLAATTTEPLFLFGIQVYRNPLHAVSTDTNAQ